MNKQKTGFTLPELVMAAAIMAAVSSWTLPRYIRGLRQSAVDRYTQSIEAGFYNLKSQLGTSRTSCQFKFNSETKWVSAKELLEFKQNDGTLATGRLLCCNSEIETANKKNNIIDECHDGPLLAELLNRSNNSNRDSLRFIRTEGSHESKQVQVAVSQSEYELTPPGTSARVEPITFMIRSIYADRDSMLRSRCVQVSGSGHLLRGTWEGSLVSGRCTG